MNTIYKEKFIDLQIMKYALIDREEVDYKQRKIIHGIREFRKKLIFMGQRNINL